MVRRSGRQPLSDGMSTALALETVQFWQSFYSDSERSHGQRCSHHSVRVYTTLTECSFLIRLRHDHAQQRTLFVSNDLKFT